MTAETQRGAAVGMSADELGERIFEACLGAFDIYSIYLGDRLGYYRLLADGAGRTSGELAEATETLERYAREWLEQQAMTGFLVVDDASAAAQERRYSLPEAHAEVLTNRDSLSYLAPAAVQVTASGLQVPAVTEAFRGGDPVPWELFGFDMRQAQGEMNRPLFLHVLAQEWLASISDVDERLRAGGHVVDVGSGYGWSAIGIATAYPEATVAGYDPDAPSVDAAQEHAAEHGVEDRVTFTTDTIEAAADAAAGSADLAIVLEAVHDMPDPVSVLDAMRRITRPDGVVLVVDEATADAFEVSGDPMERFFYGFSVTTCLPDGLSTDPSVGTGTVMRRSTLEGYARDAGFSSVEVLPIEHDQFRVYRLHQ